MIFSKIFKILKKKRLKLIDLEKSQYWTLDQLNEFQNVRLKEIISYSYKNIPGYRKKFDKVGIKPNDIKSIEDLRKIPITTREELQDNPDFINNALVTGTLYTGGSTGTSLKYYESKESGIVRWNVHTRGWGWHGFTTEMKYAILKSAQDIIIEKNCLYLNGELTTENLKRNVTEIIRFKPEHLKGYVNALYILAKYCIDNDISIKGIRSITPSSENLYPFQRETIEKAFNCKVYEEYCCNDGGACAWECEERRGLHHAMERAIIEEIDGQMIVTDLWNLGMPFIRYQNGDSVEFLETRCPCGRELPLIKVKGRQNDLIITKNGVLSPSFLMVHGIGCNVIHQNHVFRDGIRAIQYVQKPGYILEINLVKNPWCKQEEIKELFDKVSQLAVGMEIIINETSDIPKTKKFKRAFIINEDNDLLKKYSKN